MIRILLAEDDTAIAQGLCYALEQEGYAVTQAATVADAVAALQTTRPAGPADPAGVGHATLPAGTGGLFSFDLLLLDIGLPDGSGFDICRAARRQGDVPVIFLTACDDEGSTVRGLDMGADDYVPKPFRIRELQSRIRAVLRRRGGLVQPAPIALPGGVQVDPQKAEVTRDGRPLALTALEYKLLLTFLANPGQILSRGQLLEGLWDTGGNYVNDNTLSVYVKRLRSKLETPGGPVLIATVRGLGYRLEVK